MEEPTQKPRELRLTPHEVAVLTRPVSGQGGFQDRLEALVAALRRAGIAAPQAPPGD